MADILKGAHNPVAAPAAGGLVLCLSTMSKSEIALEQYGNIDYLVKDRRRFPA